jgi:hypothetical protein
VKDWALKWVEGSIASYFFSRTPLERVVGVVKRAIKPYGVEPRDEVIISLKTQDPGLNILRKVKEERAKPLLELIERLKGYEKYERLSFGNAISL